MIKDLCLSGDHLLAVIWVHVSEGSRSSIDTYCMAQCIHFKGCDFFEYILGKNVFFLSVTYSLLVEGSLQSLSWCLCQDPDFSPVLDQVCVVSWLWSCSLQVCTFKLGSWLFPASFHSLTPALRRQQGSLSSGLQGQLSRFLFIEGPALQGQASCRPLLHLPVWA